MIKTFKVSKAGACSNCRLSHRKCDRKQPCSRCISRNITDTCVYETISPYTPPNSKLKKKNNHNTKESTYKYPPSLLPLESNESINFVNYDQQNSSSAMHPYNSRKHISSLPHKKQDENITTTQKTNSKNASNLPIYQLNDHEIFPLPSSPSSSLCSSSSKSPSSNSSMSHTEEIQSPSPSSSRLSTTQESSACFSSSSFAQLFQPIHSSEDDVHVPSTFSRLSESKTVSDTSITASSQQYMQQLHTKNLLERIGLSPLNDIFGRRVGVILLIKKSLPKISMCTDEIANLWGYPRKHMTTMSWQDIMLKQSSSAIVKLRDQIIDENQRAMQRPIIDLPPLRFLAVSRLGDVFEVSRRATLYFKRSPQIELSFIKLVIFT